MIFFRFAGHIVGGPMYSRGGEMLIFGQWLDCLLGGFNLQKNDVAIFWAIPLQCSLKFKIWPKSR